MDFINNSQDVLNIAKTTGVLLLSFLFAWFIYYLVMIMRQIFQIFKEMRQWLKKVDELIEAIKKKIDHSTSYLMLIGEGIKKLVEVAKEHKGGGDKKMRKKSAKAKK